MRECLSFHTGKQLGKISIVTTPVMSPYSNAGPCKYTIENLGQGFRFPNRIVDQPLDLVLLQPWYGDTMSFAFCCETCSRKLDSAYDVVVEWGDTGIYDSLGFTCETCVGKLLHLTRNACSKTLQEVLDQVRRTN